MIDINQPVKQGEDLVINLESGEQHLGTPAEFDKLAEQNLLMGVHTDSAAVPAQAQPQTQNRDAKGHFVKPPVEPVAEASPDPSPEPSPEASPESQA